MFAPVVRTPIPAFVAMGVLVIGAAFVVPTFKKSLLPTLQDTNLLVKWDGPHGTSLPEMDRITSRAATELRAVPGVKNVGAQVGQACSATSRSAPTRPRCGSASTRRPTTARR